MNKTPSESLKSLHDQFLKRISDGRWKVGDTLKPAKDLAKEFDCSVGMVSKALAMLAQRGLVEQRKRVGTRVISDKVSDGAERAPSIKLDAYAFILPGEQHENGWMTSLGFQKAAAAEGRRFITLSTGTDFQKEAEIVRRLDEFDVQAAAIVPILVTPQDHIKFAQLIMEAKFPMVLVDHCPAGIDCPSVQFDCFHAGCTVTDHLLKTGASRIGFLTNNGLRLSGRNRHQGYVWAMRENGLQPDPELVSFESNSHPNFDDPFREPTEIAKAYLKRVNVTKLDAVVCSNDVLAIGLLRAADELGFKVPEDFRVAGIDDLRLSAELGLTTYRPPFEALGIRAFEMLDRISSGNVSDNCAVSLRGELVVRRSA